MIKRSTTMRADEKFKIAVTAGDRRGKDADAGAAEGGREGGDVVADFPMYDGIADNAALGMLSRGLELRLDQREQVHRGRRQRQRDRQYRFQRNEADVDDDDVGPRRQPLALKGANIGLFHGNDFGMMAQRRMQLPPPDIDGENHGGAIGEQYFGKTAGGCADIETDMVFDWNRVSFQRAGKLDAAARDKGVCRPRIEGGIGGNGCGCLEDRSAVGRDKTRLDRRLRPRPALEQSALDQENIDAFAGNIYLVVATGQVQPAKAR